MFRKKQKSNSVPAGKFSNRHDPFSEFVVADTYFTKCPKCGCKFNADSQSQIDARIVRGIPISIKMLILECGNCRNNL